MAKRPKKQAEVSSRDLAEEIVRRAGKVDETGARVLPYVIHLSDPPTPGERLQLAAVQLLGKTVAIVPTPCATVEEWLARYAPP
jgi:hypothetical protein